MTQKKICLIYTGGTIGMRRLPDGTLKPIDDPLQFLTMFPGLEKRVDFFPVLNKDSTNINHEDWSLIARELYGKRNDGYDGFVVTHGTDTMHFSATAMAFALGPNLNFPVVFTGSQTIPDVNHGDAKINLYRAIEVAMLRSLYKNNLDNFILLRSIVD